MYLTSTTHPMTGTWILIGMALRMLFQVGAHRSKAYRDKPNLIDELWKRCFWYFSISYRLLKHLRSIRRSLIAADRYLCASLGRPSAASDESYVSYSLCELSVELTILPQVRC